MAQTAQTVAAPGEAADAVAIVQDETCAEESDACTMLDAIWPRLVLPSPAMMTERNVNMAAPKQMSTLVRTPAGRW